MVSPLCFQKAQSFCNYFLHVCSKELLSFAYFQLLTDNVSYSLGNAGSRDCSRTSMWFTAGDGWDPANFWADCFEKTLWFLFCDCGGFPRTKIRKGSQLGATWFQRYSNMVTLKSTYSQSGLQENLLHCGFIATVRAVEKKMLKWFCLAVRHAAYGTR